MWAWLSWIFSTLNDKLIYSPQKWKNNNQLLPASFAWLWSNRAKEVQKMGRSQRCLLALTKHLLTKINNRALEVIAYIMFKSQISSEKPFDSWIEPDFQSFLHHNHSYVDFFIIHVSRLACGFLRAVAPTDTYVMSSLYGSGSVYGRFFLI